MREKDVKHDGRWTEPRARPHPEHPERTADGSARRMPAKEQGERHEHALDFLQKGMMKGPVVGD